MARVLETTNFVDRNETGKVHRTVGLHVLYVDNPM